MRLGIGIGVGSGSYEPPAPPFTPASLGDQLALWLRADMGVTLEGAGVASWADQSGNGRDFTQASAGAQPTVGATYIGGQPAIVFANDLLTGPSLSALAGAGSGELFIVMRLVADPPVAGLGGCWQFNPNGAENYINLSGTTYCGDLSTAVKNCGTCTPAGHYETARIFSVQSSPGSWKLLTDGVERFTTATNTYGATSAAALGGDPENQGVLFMNGGIAEVILCAPKLSADNRALMMAYLPERYSITL